MATDAQAGTVVSWIAPVPPLDQAPPTNFGGRKNLFMCSCTHTFTHTLHCHLTPTHWIPCTLLPLWVILPGRWFYYGCSASVTTMATRAPPTPPYCLLLPLPSLDLSLFLPTYLLPTDLLYMACMAALFDIILSGHMYICSSCTVCHYFCVHFCLQPSLRCLPRSA